ncbi:MAG: sigma-54 interaction domain-containing protein [Myxococcota bacterium]
MNDWNRVALEPSIRRLGEVLRQHFGVWVGFVEPDGTVVPIAADANAPPKPACNKFKARSALANRRDGHETCGESVEAWIEGARDADAPMVELTCHAGFSSFVYRLERASGDFAGILYASGWVPSERSHERLDRVRSALLEDELIEEDLTDALDDLVDRVPRPERRERRFMEALCEAIADEYRRLTHESSSETYTVKGHKFRGMIGGTPKMQSLFETIRRVASGVSTVLVQGENGTGKELIAQALHQESGRSERSFVALNCAAIPGELIASELFGHKRGAFSGAHKDRQGLIEEADEGTLFLDEIGDMDLHLQVKLLRFLQEGTFSRVGDNTVKRVDVRVVCATNQDLGKLVREQKFRKDLFFRINVISLHAPPLRERRGDIALLAEYFLNRAVRRLGRDKKQLLPETLDAMKAYEWPGNVRELENEIERLVLMSGGEAEIAPESLSTRIVPENAEPTFPVAQDMQLPDAVEQLERTMILRQLRQTGWNKSQTARDLGVSRRNLIRKVSQYDLERFRDE